MREIIEDEWKAANSLTSGEIARLRAAVPISGLKNWVDLRTGLNDAGLVISHLACADEPDHPMNAHQLAAFREMTDGMTMPRSLAATGGILLGADFHFDLTRPGIGLYGGMPFADAASVVGLTVPVIQVRDVGVGESVGYGSAWVASRASRIATIAAGYADGLMRASGPQLQVYAQGVACPVVGRVSMDLLTVDITDLGARPRHMDILCPEQGVDVVAEAAGTIGYEVLTQLGPRYERDWISRH